MGAPASHQWPLQVSGECCCLMTWSFLKWRSRSSKPLPIHKHPHPTPTLSLHPSSPHSQCGPGRATLMGPHWVQPLQPFHSNELRLLIHLWDPADYQVGRPTIRQWLGMAFMLLTLLPRRAETKQGQKREDQKIKSKLSTVIALVVINAVLDYTVVHSSVYTVQRNIGTSPYFWRYTRQNSTYVHKRRWEAICNVRQVHLPHGD